MLTKNSGKYKKVGLIFGLLIRIIFSNKDINSYTKNKKTNFSLYYLNFIDKTVKKRRLKLGCKKLWKVH